MTSLDCFGIRSIPPCSDCWEDGQCSMNCGPAIPHAEVLPPSSAAKTRTTTICGGRQTGKTARMMADAVKAATTGNRVLIVRADGCHTIRNVTPEQPAQTRLDKMAALMDDYWNGERHADEKVSTE